MIIFLPPNFSYENHDEISLSSSLGNQYIPNAFINRVYKSQYVIVYEIEHFSDTESQAPVTTISSQRNSSDIKGIYKELRYEPISDLLATSQLQIQRHVNIFGVVLSMNFKEEDPKCTSIQLFDFDPKSTISVKLWRGLAAWITSLSIGARLQVRNLVLKDSTLHSCSRTEIYLLAHGNGNSNIKSSLALSARAEKLNEKERDILLFLSHQSLLITCKQVALETHYYTLRLSAPLYLQYKNDKWTIQGKFNDQNGTVQLSHFDAKLWQLLTEIFFDNFNNFDLLFERLSYTNTNGNGSCICYEYLNTSILSFQTSPFNTPSCNYKHLNWNDLISSKVILFGVFELEAILDYMTQGSEESLGNLSILPSERITFLPHTILRNPSNLDQFVYIEERVHVQGEASLFKVQIKTILNDGNIYEIIRKLIFIL
jgi:hypothetical protein